MALHAATLPAMDAGAAACTSNQQNTNNNQLGEVGQILDNTDVRIGPECPKSDVK